MGIVILELFLMAALLCVLLLSDQIRHKKSSDHKLETVAEEVTSAAAAKDEADGKGFENKETGEDNAKGGKSENMISKQEERAFESESSEKTQKDDWITDKLASMTVEEKVSQLFMLTPEGLTGVNHVVAAGDVTKNAIDAFPIGGLIYFGSNIETPPQISTMISKTQSYALNRTGIPMFIAVDEEGGYVSRIAKNSNFDVAVFPYASEIGKTGDVADAYEMGDAIGAYLKSYGFNVDFAPVADVLSNSENEVVKNRSFGSDARLVSDMVAAELEGLQSHQIVGCVKHFPGHGATVGDTHKGYAYTEKTWEELLTCEMHLRYELGYDGIVITDSLGMGAVTDTYDSKQAAVSVLKAGGDMLLNPMDFKSAYEGILSEISQGGISEQRIDESVYRILSVKYDLLNQSDSKPVKKDGHVRNHAG